MCDLRRSLLLASESSLSIYKQLHNKDHSLIAILLSLNSLVFTTDGAGGSNVVISEYR